MTAFQLKHQKSGRVLSLRNQPLVVGRGEDCHLTLSSDTVSRRHAVLEAEWTVVWVTDQGSSNGTFVNGTRLDPHKRTRMAAGDEVRFGTSTTFTLTGGPSAVTIMPPAGKSPPRPAPVPAPLPPPPKLPPPPAVERKPQAAERKPPAVMPVLDDASLSDLWPTDDEDESTEYPALPPVPPPPAGPARLPTASWESPSFPPDSLPPVPPPPAAPRPAPPPVYEPTTGTLPQGRPPDFGFEPNRVDFEQEGVGRQTATRLNDRFRPIQVLSAGGMGKIILAQEALSGRFVAMKVVLEEGQGNRPLIEQFVREAVITARLQHPHIIPVYDLGFLGGNQLYYTMRYVEGENLRKILPAVGLPERVRILRSAALAVDYAHAIGLWHRDLKPENLLVGPIGDTYVIDWGLVTVVAGADYRLNIPKVVVGNLDLVIPDNLIRETSNALTAEGSMVGGAIGTPLYMSPEQMRNDQPALGPASDVWAFGVMLYEALTGVHPLKHLAGPNPTFFEMHHSLMYDEFVPPRALDPTVPDELERLCLRLLAKDRPDRPDRLAEFLTGTADFLRSNGLTVSTYGRPPSGSSLAASEIETLRMQNALLRTELDTLKRKHGGGGAGYN